MMSSAMVIDVDIVVFLRNDKLWTGDNYINSIKKVSNYYDSLFTSDGKDKESTESPCKPLDDRLR
jgi:hypothetical protein